MPWLLLVEDNLLSYSSWSFKTAFYRLGHLNTITVEMIVLVISFVWLGLLLDYINKED